MCGIACYLGRNKEEGLKFGVYSEACMNHRGPDDKGLYNDEDVTLAHTRLAILDLSASGHQPMTSSCGRYVIVYNGEIYNHLDIRKKYFSDHQFRGHSDTETILEFFRLKQEQMLTEMVGMWAIIIWDKKEKKLFISRSRLGQKPLYMRNSNGAWVFASEIKPLIRRDEHLAYDITSVVEFLALGNYGHLGAHTFFRDIWQFPEGSFAWLSDDDKEIKPEQFWKIPDIPQKDKIPFTKEVKNELHDIIVEAVLSETLSDVPIGITLSGGVDSSIIAGILASYYDKETHVFTAQSPNSAFDETRYVNAVLNKYPNSHFIVHRADLNELSLSETLTRYIKIQEEPFGDPSIIAHGFLMSMAADAGIKVILNGQGADELFFGYNNMAQAIVSSQIKHAQVGTARKNLRSMHLGREYFIRTLLKSFMPGIEYNLRTRSRISRREMIKPEVLTGVDNSLVTLYKYNNLYDVWQESLYGVHMPHLVHYDDRNAMAYSIEGRMPFLDHRIAEYVARIRPDEFLKNGMRKYILREACRDYLPDLVYNRRDKIGFYTPLINMLTKDEAWVKAHFRENSPIKSAHVELLLKKLTDRTLNVNDALQIWRSISLNIWMDEYNAGLSHK